MNYRIDYTAPESEEFWQAYTELWKNSLNRPAFQSPKFIRFLAAWAKGEIAICQGYLDGQLMAVALFKKKAGVYHFLSDEKSDHNFFVIHESCSESEISEFFENFLAEVKKEKWAMILHRQPETASYLPVLKKLGESSGMFWATSRCSVCPMFVAESPEDLYAQMNKSRVRTYANRLKKQHQATFEALTGSEDLENWVKEYCRIHLKRWASTDTPSVYRDETRQQFLYDCLKAWIADGILVRFSINTPEGRIAFKVGLIQQNSLISHSHTYDPDYHSSGPGKVLLRHAGEWMKNNGLSTLDFGYGNESYKYQYANREVELTRIYASGDFNMVFMLKTWMMKFAKNASKNRKLQTFYRQNIKPLVLKMK